MDVRELTEDYAVGPQIGPEDIPALKQAGFTTVICNRPDSEVAADRQADAIRQAAEAAGMNFVMNPVVHGALTMETVEAQGEAIKAADGRVFAYCASGNRSSIVWALSQAGARDTDEMIAAAARNGYHQLAQFRDQIEALAESGN